MTKETNIKCPYCHKQAKWCENKEVYGKNYGRSYMIWLCKDCNAYVGCHKNSKNPLGTMANSELRKWRIKTHSVIDPLWKSGEVKRYEVYKMLKETFGKEIHIGESDIDTCKDIINYFNPKQ